jgi:hypothetical protein
MFAQQPMPKAFAGFLPPRSLTLPDAVGGSKPARQPSQASSSTASADYLAAADFLAGMVKAWPDHWYLNVCAIPAQGGAVTGQSWAARDVAANREKIAAWLERENRSCAGIYWTPNPLRGPVQKKPTKGDLGAVVRLAVDLDPPGDDRPFGERWAAVLKAAGKMQQDSSTQPSLILDSGNGIGVFYKLAEPEADLARAEAACRALHSRAANEYGLKVDGTHNSDRLMRLPRTRNWPNAKKIAAGYSREPSGSRVLYENGAAALDAAALDRLVAEDVHAAPRRAVSVSVLPPPTPAVRAQQEGRIAEVCKVLAAEWISFTQATDWENWPEAFKTRFENALLDHRGLLRRWQGQIDGLADPSRSGLEMALVAACKAAGFDPVDTARILWAFDHGKVRNEPTVAAQCRTIARAWVRSEADRKEDADACDRIAAAGRGAAERTLADALASTPELVAKMLKCSVLDDAVSDAILTRELVGWAARASMGKVDLRNLRKRALTAAARARADAEKRETAAGRPIIEIGTDLHSVVEQ